MCIRHNFYPSLNSFFFSLLFVSAVAHIFFLLHLPNTVFNTLCCGAKRMTGRGKKRTEFAFGKTKNKRKVKWKWNVYDIRPRVYLSHTQYDTLSQKYGQQNRIELIKNFRFNINKLYNSMQMIHHLLESNEPGRPTTQFQYMAFNVKSQIKSTVGFDLTLSVKMCTNQMKRNQQNCIVKCDIGYSH